MLVHTNRGEIELGKCEGTMESLPELCFECKILSKDLHDEIEAIITEDKKRQFNYNSGYFNELGYDCVEKYEADNVMEEFCYIILFLKKDSDKITALYERGGTDEMGFIDYCASVRLELKDSKQELKTFILSALEQYYF